MKRYFVVLLLLFIAFMRKTVKNIPLIWNILCGSSSVLSILLLILGNKNAIILALSFFCLTLLVLLIIIVRAINNYLKIGKDADFVRIYTDIKYETDDGYNINYNTYRIIQSKCVLLQQIDHGFKWSGSKPPKISSDLQELTGTSSKGDNDDEYDEAHLKFRTPLLYNETAVVHFRAQMDDCDEKSETMLSYKASSYSELIHFRVILKHKDSNYKQKAKVYIRKIGSSTLSKEKEIETIPFDLNTKSYEYIKERPEIGYFYILRWDR